MEMSDKISFAESIDFTDLFSHAERVTGVKLEFTKPEVISEGMVYVSFHSGDMTEKCGVFSNILESCYISPFTGAVDTNITGERKFLWLDISLCYRHKDGECGNMVLFNAWYTEGLGWRFLNVGE